MDVRAENEARAMFMNQVIANYLKTIARDEARDVQKPDKLDIALRTFIFHLSLPENGRSGRATVRARGRVWHVNPITWDGEGVVVAATVIPEAAFGTEVRQRAGHGARRRMSGRLPGEATMSTDELLRWFVRQFHHRSAQLVINLKEMGGRIRLFGNDLFIDSMDD